VTVAELLAAGGLLWRGGTDGSPEVAVVHRPRYDDWSLPKGKRNGDEPLAATAVREITEETGHDVVLGLRLPSTHYRVPDGGKTVSYWAARCTGGEFIPNDEVDELRWLDAREACGLLSYAHDRSVVERLGAAVTVCSTVLLVRHAKAGARDRWEADDTVRPLSGAGWRQTEALRSLLPLFGPRRIHAAPRTRCVQTVEALAGDLGVPVAEEPLLSEEGYWADPAAGLHRFEEIARSSGGPAVVCSQGGVIPDVVETLLARSGRVDRELRSRKGSVWVLSFAQDLRLVAADHHSDPYS